MDIFPQSLKQILKYPCFMAFKLYHERVKYFALPLKKEEFRIPAMVIGIPKPKL
jgi:hypothetical protein